MFETEAVDVAARGGPPSSATELIARRTSHRGRWRWSSDCFRAPDIERTAHGGANSTTALYAQAKERLDDIARNRGFDGRLVVMGESDIAPGDCRIEWADGGLVRERAAIEAAIAEAVDRYVAVRRGGTQS